jgi:predicted porin
VKKILLVASVAASVLPVGAMAAPLFYGKMNLSVDKTNDYPEAALVLSQDDLSDAWDVSSNNSRLGLKGEELLYNDSLSLIYQIEAGYDADGDDDSTFTTRNSFLGLDTPMGKIFAGRYDSVVKLAEGKIDQFNDTLADLDAVLLGQRRNSNSLNWESMDLGGFVMRAQVAPGEGESISAAGQTDTKEGLTDTWGLSVTYQADVLYAALAYESGYTQIDFDVPAPVRIGGDIQTWRGSFGINFANNLQFGGIVEQSDFDPVAGEGGDVMSYLLSGRFGLSERIALKGQVGMLDSSELDLDIQTLTFGADYKLGNQTIVYGLASISETDYDDPNGPLFDVDESGSAFSLGMIHTF